MRRLVALGLPPSKPPGHGIDEKDPYHCSCGVSDEIPRAWVTTAEEQELPQLHRRGHHHSDCDVLEPGVSPESGHAQGAHRNKEEHVGSCLQQLVAKPAGCALLVRPVEKGLQCLPGRFINRCGPVSNDCQCCEISDEYPAPGIHPPSWVLSSGQVVLAKAIAAVPTAPRANTASQM